MLIFIAALGIGFLLLMWSANTFANNALLLGKHFNISKILIGIVILGFGTSAPELLVSALSAWQGNAGLAIGNAIGSNITNILLVLGATLCILAIRIDAKLIRKNFLLLLAATALFSLLIFDQQLSFVDGVILAIALIFILYLLSRFEDQTDNSADETLPAVNLALPKIVTGLFIGLAVLLASSKLVVWSATEVALQLGVSDIIIGLTIVAFGTSLPELATCVASAMKRHGELALGNIVGSNIFNTLGVTATASLITSYNLPEKIYTRDYPVMLIATGVLFLLVMIFLRKKIIPRGFGLLFIAGYAAYIYLIYTQSL
ncbi:MAG: calcium/sodium antiporter [Gammaproteobacteria bacterium]|nr:MAG: calcium/sodium antiporter [Gammaproteobacteria bacterium]